MIYKFEKEDEGKLVSEINVTVPLTYKQIIIHNKDQDPHDIHLEKGGLDYSKNLGGLLCEEEYGISDKDPKIHKGKVITEFADTQTGESEITLKGIVKFEPYYLEPEDKDMGEYKVEPYEVENEKRD